MFSLSTSYATLPTRAALSASASYRLRSASVDSAFLRSVMSRTIFNAPITSPAAFLKILTNTRRVPWTNHGFRHSWNDELARPVMALLRERRRVFHGLRKSAVVFLLEAGCTDAEVCAITGQSREMVEQCSAGEPKKAR